MSEQESTTSSEFASTPVISLVSADWHETVPHGVPLADLHLPSLDTTEVKDWLAQTSNYTIFVVTGRDLESQGTPALPVYVTMEEYASVAAAMPRWLRSPRPETLSGHIVTRSGDSPRR
jgi:hypothetical protein